MSMWLPLFDILRILIAKGGAVEIPQLVKTRVEGPQFKPEIHRKLLDMKAHAYNTSTEGFLGLTNQPAYPVWPAAGQRERQANK